MKTTDDNLRSKNQQRNGFDMSNKEGFKNSKLLPKTLVGCSEQRGQQLNFKGYMAEGHILSSTCSRGSSDLDL